MLGDVAPEHTKKTGVRLISYHSSVGWASPTYSTAWRFDLWERPSRNPVRIANCSKRDSASRLVVCGGGSPNLFNPSAIGGFLRTCGCPLLALRWVILVHFRVVSGSSLSYLLDRLH